MQVFAKNEKIDNASNNMNFVLLTQNNALYLDYNIIHKDTSSDIKIKL